MSTILVNISDLIAVTPYPSGDRPVIAGTRTSVGRIVALYRQGYSVEEIVADKDYLTLAQVHAALAYYYANPQVINQDLAAEAAAYDQLAPTTS
ncbi:DUF433 domain-containing protein [Leptolyngbya sp. PCC 6406]|uniref:DUF433 domain-containing protein n=1 Tax=Leptolyngbya sp. PCC 6406 TaxID=1173264 RepID=UPI0002ABCCC8|nr:DUF433 domain-containing protein [Leptolyngbya sp. PCC 6406]